MKVTCLIPFHNERKRIGNVLQIITKVSSIDEIICIDDGSTDGGFEMVQKDFPSVKLIRIEKNVGKSTALLHGLQMTKGEYCLLMDADLRDLQVTELQRGIQAILDNPNIDMIIFRRLFDPLISKIFRGDLLVSGERILRTSDLREVLSHPVKGYEIEVAINYYMQDKKKLVYWVYHSGKNLWKAGKVGFWKGMHGEIKFYISALRFKGSRRYLSNMLLFARKELS